MLMIMVAFILPLGEHQLLQSVHQLYVYEHHQFLLKPQKERKKEIYKPIKPIFIYLPTKFTIQIVSFPCQQRHLTLFYPFAFSTSTSQPSSRSASSVSHCHYHHFASKHYLNNKNMNGIKHKTSTINVQKSTI